MGKKLTLAKRKPSAKLKSAARKWHLTHLVVAAGILAALAVSIPVGAYIKASILVADDA